MTIAAILQRGPVLPVLVIHDAGTAVDLAGALLAGGIDVFEITLRTPAAIDALRRIRAQLPRAVAGVGSVLDRAQWLDALDAGAQFGVSPGLTPALATAVREAGVPFVPGVATAAEAMVARDAGFDCLKLFPAEAIGGRALLRALHGPLPQLRFCPTGGIHPGNAADYLALPNVICVGGSWLAPDDLVAQRAWDRITALAQAASGLRR